MVNLIKRCVGVINKKGDDEESDEEESLDEEGYQQRKSIQLINDKRVLFTFIAKVLLVKMSQQCLSIGYVLFVILYNYTDIFKDVPNWCIIFPILVVGLIFISVHFAKSPPHVLISVVLLFVMSVCWGHIIGTLYRMYQFYAFYVLLTFCCLFVTNTLMMPFLIVSKLWLNIKRLPYYLVPQLINLVINIAIIVTCIVCISTETIKYKTHLHMRSTVDAVFLLCFPTVFWSASLTLLMTINLKKIVQGNFYFVSRSKDIFLFAALYFF